jgi:hypothetical protein
MANLVYAQWSALNSGCAVTTNYHGEDVMPGMLVTATAGTTDADVESVTFLWKDPDENTVKTETVPVWSNGSEWKGKIIYYAQSSYTHDVFDDWCVQAFFIGDGVKRKAQIDDVVKIETTSFFVIPDFPVVDTAGALIAMMIGLSLFAYKRKMVSHSRL